MIRKLSNCSTCPLDGTCRKVWAAGENAAPRIVVIGESPGSVEVETGVPFTGPAGKMLRSLLHQAGLNPLSVALTNVISCQPPGDDMESYEGQQAELSCRPGFEAELKSFHLSGARVILAVGNVPMRALGITGKISKQRGSVFEITLVGCKFFVVPTFHPSYLIRGNQHEIPTCISDIQKVMRIADEGWRPPKENFNLFPTIEWLEAKTEELVSNPLPLRAIDIEGFKRIVVVGIGEDAENGFSIPFLRKGGEDYWPDLSQRLRAEACLRELLTNCQFVAQNAAFDFGAFVDAGFTDFKLPHDTMLLHHCWSPEIPHDLGYIASQFADTPYWKDIMLANEVVLLAHDDAMLRTYNLRDCVVLFPIFEKLYELNEKQGTLKVYEEIERPLLRPVIALKHNGMRMIESRLPAWREQVAEEIVKARAKFTDITNVPKSYSPTSPHHNRWLFFGQKPASLDAKRALLASYDVEGTRKKKSTKAYRELAATLETFDKVVPLPRLKGAYKRTDSGQWALDTQGMNKMRIMANAELETIAKYVRKAPKHTERELELHRMVTALNAFHGHSKWFKLGSTYTKFPIGPDGRIHPSYLIHGTDTGRLSSRQPNWQNLPPIVKLLFGPAKGYAYVLADYTSIEMIVLAYESGDTVLQESFARGEKIHNQNVKVMFGLEPDHPMFDYAKRACKTYIFGRGYGGGLWGIFERASMQVPELGLTFQRFKEVDEAYRQAHPAYFEWADRTQAVALEAKRITTATGRVRNFVQASDSEIKRKALNTPIQGVAGDIANMALIEIEKWIRQNSPKSKLVSTVHDSIGIECPLAEVPAIAAAMKTIMTKPHQLWGRDVSFPIELEVAVHSWGETMSLEEFTNGSYTGRGDPRFTADSAKLEWGDDSAWGELSEQDAGPSTDTEG